MKIISSIVMVMMVSTVFPITYLHQLGSSVFKKLCDEDTITQSYIESANLAFGNWVIIETLTDEIDALVKHFKTTSNNELLTSLGKSDQQKRYPIKSAYIKSYNVNIEGVEHNWSYCINNSRLDGIALHYNTIMIFEKGRLKTDYMLTSLEKSNFQVKCYDRKGVCRHFIHFVNGRRESEWVLGRFYKEWKGGKLQNHFSIDNQFVNQGKYFIWGESGNLFEFGEYRNGEIIEQSRLVK